MLAFLEVILWQPPITTSNIDSGPGRLSIVEYGAADRRHHWEAIEMMQARRLPMTMCNDAVYRGTAT